VTLVHSLMIDNTWAGGCSSGYISPQPKGTEGVSALLSKMQEEIENQQTSDSLIVKQFRRQS
jgi:hypothetical protein